VAIEKDSTASESTMHIESASPGGKEMLKTSKSRNTTNKLPPVHPGEILRETLGDLGISMNRLSKEIHVPANRISSIVAGQRAITGETALRLARYLGTTPEYWLNMQARYDLETARDEWADRVESEVRPRHAAR
jgi:addiction module HigA family antidote